MAGPDSDVRPETDWFHRTATRWLGGPLGRHAGAHPGWLSPIRIALLAATLIWVIAAIRNLPCRTTEAGQYPDTYRNLCYSDIPLLYRSRGLAQGNIPYLDTGDYQTLEYPVLTGWFLELERRITALLGAPVGDGLSEQQQIDAANVFFDVNTVLLGVLFLLAVWAHARTPPTGDGRQWDVLMLAASPCVALAGLINWDMLPVALTALGFMFWARRRPGLAGVMLGLGTAAKLYPLLFLGPLLLLCLRSRQLQPFGRLSLGFAVAWLLPNLPVLLLAPREWLAFWTFNSDRGGDLGSIWYVLSLAGHPVDHLNLVNTMLLVLMCAGIGWLIISAERRPRLGQVAFLVLAAFLITNKVYSPQYVLWLLPLMILARPRWRDWAVFSFGEIIYFLAIWAHLDQSMVPGDGGPDRLYWLAVIIRIGCELWVVAVVVRDILYPEHDPIRRPRHDLGPTARPAPAIRYGPDTDDPGGGVLDQAPDATWVNRLRATLTAR